MKYLSKGLLVAATLTTSPLLALSSSAWKAGGAAGQDGRTFIRLSEEPRPQGFEAQVRGGEVVGMTLVSRDGSRVALSRPQKPACPAGGPAGQKPPCREDEAQVTSISACGATGLRATREVILAGGT